MEISFLAATKYSLQSLPTTGGVFTVSFTDKFTGAISFKILYHAYLPGGFGIFLIFSHS